MVFLVDSFQLREATTGGPAHQPLTLLDELLEETLLTVAVVKEGDGFTYIVYVGCIYIYGYIRIYMVYICHAFLIKHHDQSCCHWAHVSLCHLLTMLPLSKDFRTPKAKSRTEDPQTVFLPLIFLV